MRYARIAWALGLLTLLGGLPWAVGSDPGAVTSGGVSSQLDFKGQLEKGLKARRPVEFQYISEVVKMVEQKKLPRSLVDSSFMYARRMPSKQIQYFQFSLRARASKMGLETPTLDNQITRP